MRSRWLQKVDGAPTILYFTGWSMDGREVLHLCQGKFNVLAVYDYSSLDIADLPTADYVIAWSFGVAIVELLDVECSTKAIAFAGSTLPVSEKFGISPQVFGATVDGYSEVGRKKFLRRIGLDIEYAPGYSELQKASLLNMAEFSVEEGKLFNQAVVATKDRIFPPQNLMNFWKQQNVEIVELASGHYPFGKFTSWDEVLNVG